MAELLRRLGCAVDHRHRAMADDKGAGAGIGKGRRIARQQPPHQRRTGDQLAIGHRLQRLERRNQFGQATGLARIGHDIGQRIVASYLAVRNASDQMDRSGRRR